MRFKQEFNSTIFDVNFKNKINFIIDDSGTGKTFLMKMMMFYCDNNNIHYTHVDYVHKNMPLSGDVLLFDKADLYFTNEIFNKIKNLDAISIISIKNKNHLNMCGDIGIYRLINKGNNIKVVEWGCDD